MTTGEGESQDEGVLVCRSLTKRFGDTVAVDDLSFTVRSGTVTAFVGANGAGKTTTMRMLVGLVTPTSGHALVHGHPYRALARPRDIGGAMLDGPGAHPAHRARTHLAITATAAGIPADRVTEVLELVGLVDHAHRRVGTFSTGMRQRLALAAALLGDPAVLILDEPANGLDPPGIVWMRNLLRRLAREGRAVLVSSHLLPELAEVADRVIIIDRGRLVADAPLAELLAGRSHVTELRCADPAAVVGAISRTDLASARIEGDLIMIEGLSAGEVGELVSSARAGPVHHLVERPVTFEEIYFELAGTLTRPARGSGTDGTTGPSA